MTLYALLDTTGSAAAAGMYSTRMSTIIRRATTFSAEKRPLLASAILRILCAPIAARQDSPSITIMEKRAVDRK